MPERDIQAILNWAVWANLERHKDVELVLLKGHLLLEAVLSDEIEDKKLSFHGKVRKYCKLGGKSEIADLLEQLNQMRNKLAHEFPFDIEKVGIVEWADAILETFEPTYYTR
jgi:hypothetical protein